MDTPTSGESTAGLSFDPPAPGIFDENAGEAAEPAANEDYWRREVAARLERYRSRRKVRAPRYPSLRLPFDAADRSSRSSESTHATAPSFSSMLARQNVAFQMDSIPEPAAALEVAPPAIEEAETTAKIIEFPRSAAIPVYQGDELAEPVWERPRIVEAPEVVPPPPALGGILIETAEQERPRPADDDLPLQSASMARRGLAGCVDFAVLAIATAGFGAIFLKLNPERAPLPILTAGAAVVLTLLWAIYQFLFMVYTGSTPGLRVTRLSLVRFDGLPVHRSLRRWRVLASYLSALSLGLGCWWSLLDQDSLSWHDRITHTYLRAGSKL